MGTGSHWRCQPGASEVRMYAVRFYKGDYPQRQRQASADGCVAYVEQHFNSSSRADADYAVVIVGANASQTSRSWGRWYAAAVAREFGIPLGGDAGLRVGGYNGRGDANLRYTAMPALLLEPLFASNPRHAEWIRGAAGQARLAHILCESIQRFFQDGGLIGFSVGHKYKASNPRDRGATVVGGGSEADYAEQVLRRAQALLTGAAAPVVGRTVRVVQGETVLWTGRVDEDADVTWDPVRGLLRIDGAPAAAPTTSTRRPRSARRP